jgi:hypothetical protein
MTVGQVTIAGEDNSGRGREEREREGGDEASARPYNTAVVVGGWRWRVGEGDTGCGDKDVVVGGEHADTTCVAWYGSDRWCGPRPPSEFALFRIHT